MGKRQAIKNIKRVSCRFDMDVPEELLAKIQESIRREATELKKCFPQTPYPMMYPYMPMTMPGMQAETAKTEKPEQMETQTKTPETEELNEAALDFMDSFMGG